MNTTLPPDSKTSVIDSVKVSLPSRNPESEPGRVALEIPFTTIIKLLAAALLVYCTIALMPILVTLFLAIMLAVTLYPILRYCKAKGLPSWVGITLIISGILLTMGLVFTMILPPLIEQSSRLMENLPEIKKAALEHIPQSGPLQSVMESALKQVQSADPSKLAMPLVSAGQIALGGFAELFLVLIFTIYLMTDGPRAVEWMLAFFSAEKKNKLIATARDTSKVVSAYVAGQLITSVICGVYTFVVLTLLHVPAALMLATIAGIFDVLPVLGFFLAAAPAVLLGMTISPLTSVLVAGVYVLYHALENYILIPKIYGNRLRLSDLVVLVSLLAAGTLGGIVGAIVILPWLLPIPLSKESGWWTTSVNL